jgi:hypothetical protein
MAQCEENKLMSETLDAAAKLAGTMVETIELGDAYDKAKIKNYGYGVSTDESSYNIPIYDKGGAGRSDITDSDGNKIGNTITSKVFNPQTKQWEWVQRDIYFEQAGGDYLEKKTVEDPRFGLSYVKSAGWRPEDIYNDPRFADFKKSGDELSASINNQGLSPEAQIKLQGDTDYFKNLADYRNEMASAQLAKYDNYLNQSYNAASRLPDYDQSAYAQMQNMQAVRGIQGTMGGVYDPAKARAAQYAMAQVPQQNAMAQQMAQEEALRNAQLAQMGMISDYGQLSAARGNITYGMAKNQGMYDQTINMATIENVKQALKQQGYDDQAIQSYLGSLSENYTKNRAYYNKALDDYIQGVASEKLAAYGQGGSTAAGIAQAAGDIGGAIEDAWAEYRKTSDKNKQPAPQETAPQKKTINWDENSNW